MFILGPLKEVTDIHKATFHMLLNHSLAKPIVLSKQYDIALSLSMATKPLCISMHLLEKWTIA